MSQYAADTPLQFVKGVGPKRAAWLAAAGLRTVADLLEYLPTRYLDDQGDVAVADLEPGMQASVRGEIVSIGGRWPSARAKLHDETGAVMLRWFNVTQGIQGLARGACVRASGKVQVFNDELEIVQPRIERLDQPRGPTGSFTGGRERPAPGADARGQPDAGGPAAAAPRKRAVYRTTGELKSEVVRAIVGALLEAPRLPVAEFLPVALRRRHELPERQAALRALHEPRNDAELEAARRRLKYEEFLLLELAMALRRRRIVALHRSRRFRLSDEIDRRIRARFPFELTAAQSRAAREIAGDLASGRPMTRLLQGDVGSGKTVVALYACLLAIAHRAQAAILAPTELLAQQHFASVERYLDGSRVRRILLSGALSRSQRLEALRRIEAGEIDLVVGTQALLEKDVAFRELGLTVIDEQHRFGVLQRAAIRTKGLMPHYLVMTATPIPRTLAMTVFGDLDVSLLDASPPGRGAIRTQLAPRGQWMKVMADLRRRLESGEQAYVVCPLIGESVDAPAQPADAPDSDGGPPAAAPAHSESSPARLASSVAGRPSAPAPSSQRGIASAKATFERLTRGPWRGLEVGLLHGGMKAGQKQDVIAAFAAGRLRALVATTVIEVGIDVPSATLMVIEHAERFGLSQLHQLRGRVGRGSRDSLCILLFQAHAAKARERLTALAQTTDGFAIAEADLRLRGPGELFGTRQHGLPELRFGSLIDDFELLELARRDAFELVRDDPELRQDDHAALWPALRRMFRDRLSLIDAA